MPAFIWQICCVVIGAMMASCIWQPICARMRCAYMMCLRSLDLNVSQAGRVRGAKGWISCTPCALRSFSIFTFWPHKFPNFSMANDISRERVIGLIISFNIKEAVALLREVYPVTMPQRLDYDMSEEAGDLSHQGESYAPIQRDLIDTMEQTYELVLVLGSGIAHNFGAHGRCGAKA